MHVWMGILPPRGVLRCAAATPWERRAAMGRCARAWVATQGLCEDQGVCMTAFMRHVAHNAEQAHETGGQH